MALDEIFLSTKFTTISQTERDNIVVELTNRGADRLKDVLTKEWLYVSHDGTIGEFDSFDEFCRSTHKHIAMSATLHTHKKQPKYKGIKVHTPDRNTFFAVQKKLFEEGVTGVRLSESKLYLRVDNDGHFSAYLGKTGFDQSIYKELTPAEILHPEQNTNFDSHKVVVPNTGVSVRVQKALFKLGYKWPGSGTNVVNVDRKYMYINLNKTLGTGTSADYFKRHVFTEINYQVILDAAGTEKEENPPLDERYKNTREFLRDIKVEVKSQDVSSAVQKLLFSYGFKWQHYNDLNGNCRYLYTNNVHIMGNNDANYFKEVLAYRFVTAEEVLALDASLKGRPKYCACKVDCGVEPQNAAKVVKALIGEGYQWNVLSPFARFLYIHADGNMDANNDGVHFTNGIGYNVILMDEILNLKNSHTMVTPSAFANIKVAIPSGIDLLEAVLDKLKQEGFKEPYAPTNLRDYAKQGVVYLITYANKSKINWLCYENSFNNHPHKEIHWTAIVGPNKPQTTKQQINHGNRNGNPINLQATQSLITGGTRPTGQRISGRTSRITVTVGHLSNQAVNSNC